jgi:hypothetical protein
MLTEHPGIAYAFTSDTNLEPDDVTVTLAIRATATCEFKLPRGRYDDLAILQMIEQQTSGS